jgi:hypothetical protein
LGLGAGVLLVAEGLGEALVVDGVAVGVTLALPDVLRLVVGLVLGVLLALVLADALVLAEAVLLAEGLVLAEVLRDGVAEADALPEGSALTEADALPEAEAPADADVLPDAVALTDAFGDFDAADADAAWRADFFLAVFFFADFDVVAGCADFGDFAGCAAASSRIAAFGRLAQAPFTMGGPELPRSKVTEPNTSELVEMISAPATAPSATDLSATALMT